MSIEQIAALTRRGRYLEGVAAGVAEEMAEIKAKLAELIEPGDSLDVDGSPIRVQPANRSFDDGIAAKILWERSPERLALCEVRSWDAKKLKAELTGAELEVAMVRKPDAAPSVRLS